MCLQLPGINMSITLNQYWLALKKSIAEFDKQPRIASGDDDKKSYQLQRTFLERLAQLGLEFESASLFSKISLAPELKAFPEKVLGKEKMITSLGGILSTSFAEHVYLPHLKRFNEVSLDDQNVVIRQFVNLDHEKQEILVYIRKMELLLQGQRQPSPLLAMTTFSAPQRTPIAIEEKESEEPTVKA